MPTDYTLRYKTIATGINLEEEHEPDASQRAWAQSEW
jgi:hypothetical protein